MRATQERQPTDGVAALPPGGTVRPDSGQVDRPPSWERIVAAARRCFSDRGVRRTTMSDVANESGVSRQLVYRIFANRRDLIEAAAAERVGELADELAPHDWGVGLDADSFVAASIGVIRGIRLDAELRRLLGEESPVSLHEVLWLDSVRARGVGFWLPWLRRARVSGLLRAGVPDVDLADWLQTVYASIILRRSLDEATERVMITRFVLTSLSMAAEDSAGPTCE
ncbi:TetR/AcrR family transcriptional regulator [Pseudonocardia sp. RS010]|uniref:TetR/AcrR family transcriptional regulator n=1 Tax=Pseudonocardia sp. RS010 TaxID=3385979 RepID=UPI0039A0472F